MTDIIAGHWYASITPGERCTRENCSGVASLVELMALVDLVRVGEFHIAHTGTLLGTEIEEMKAAKLVWDKHLATVVGW